MSANLASAAAAPAGERDDEILAQSERSRVVRRAVGSNSVICKQYLGSGAAKRAHHEASILERLSAIPGISKLAAAQRGDSILLVDDAAVPLSVAMRPEKLTIDLVLRIALELAKTIAEMHRIGIIHRDINPSNILLVGPHAKPTIIDFDIASSSLEERPAFTAHTEIAGTLAYVAPEQTGRTGRTSDQRADLYALGVTLYELATGRLPFESEDTFSLIRDHLAREPAAPAAVDARVPQALSDMIVRLLQKEPDRRYQSAAGLAGDLALLIERRAAGDDAIFPLAERDFPLRITPPSRLIGREAEIATLHAAFGDAMAGRCNALFVAGAPGVGKTVLIDELRAVVTARGGWYVASKFDQFQQSVETGAVRSAIRQLVSLLLAEAEEELAPIRARLLARLGPNAGVAAGIVPELAILLSVAAETMTGDPSTMQSRIAKLGLDLLQSIASPQRPVVCVLDDLQWANAVALASLDAVLSDPPVPGLLLIGAYRSAEVDAAHPLSALLPKRNRSFATPHKLQLANLTPGALCDLLQEMLRLPRAAAKHLAHAVGARTHGNPYDTVELIDGLRRDGALRPGPTGWAWDPATIRTYIGEGDVVDLLHGRIDALPARARSVLEIMACLGGDVPGALLEVAGQFDAAELEDGLQPSLDDGLILVVNAAVPAFRFRHDRVQQAAYGRLENAGIPLRLTLARRLAATGSFELLAAQQYLAALEALSVAEECRRVVTLFHAAAERSTATANQAAAERFLSAALALLHSSGADDEPLVSLLQIDRHAALFALGRLEEADEVYRSIERRNKSPLDLVESASVQISSLTNRNRPFEAIEIGLALLAQIGFAPPDRDGLAQAVAARVDTIYAFADGVDGNVATLDVPIVVAAAKIIRQIMPAAFFSDQRTLASWLVIESLSLWARFGPRSSLVGPISLACYVTTALKDDYSVGYRVARRILGESETRGYEPQTSYSRFLFALGVEHWFEPAEKCVAQARQAQDGLLRSGELHLACHAYYATIPLLLVSSETLEEYTSENEAALALCHRTGNDQSAELFLAYRQLDRALRGETVAEGSFTDGSFDENEHAAVLDANPMAAGYFHLMRAYSALLFGQTPELIRYADAAMAHYSTTTAVPASVLTHLIFALAAARQSRNAGPQERADSFDRLDVSRDWMRRRAHDAPDNFRYALDFIDAERAWAQGDLTAAGVAFEAAIRSARLQRSPVHVALVSERAAIFYLEAGLVRYARLLLIDARDSYAKWGASAKALNIERAYASLLESEVVERGRTTRTTNVSSDSIDMMGILRASQALSSQTSVEQLKVCVAELLASLTGATSVLLVVRSDDTNVWSLPSSGAYDESVEDAGARGLLPLAVFRFVERTYETVIVADAARDDRFARDPYFAGIDMCSMLVVPILSQGKPRAILILENRLGRGAFSDGRLDAVKLIAGQLAVSLENALLYASLERKVAERTDALAAANALLEQLSLTDALTGLANRRDFDQKLESEWVRARRSGRPLGLAMIDVDEFKKYNDCYGHSAGDACLRRIAAVLGAGLRVGHDLAARYGGEEFALILPETSLEGVYSVAERIRNGIASLAEPHVEAAHGIVTVSVGVAAIVPTEGSDATACIRTADLALYEGKRSGRNRVVRAGMPGLLIFPAFTA